MRRAYYLRKDLGLTTRQTVDKFEREKQCILTPRQLLAFERGNLNLDSFMLPRMADMYGVSTEELLEDDGVDWRLVKLGLKANRQFNPK